MELGVHDVRRIEELEADLAGLAETPGYATATLRRLQRLVPSITLTYNRSDLVNAVGQHHREPAVPPERLARLMAEFTPRMAENPALRFFRDHPDAAVVRWCDLVPPEVRARSELHRRYYARLGIGHQVAVRLPDEPGIVAGIAVSRGARCFDERDVEVLRRLQPALAAAHRAHRWRATARGLGALLRVDGWSVFQLDLATLTSRPIAVEGASSDLVALGGGDAVRPEVRSWLSEMTPGDRPPGGVLEGRLRTGAGEVDVRVTATSAGQALLLLRPRPVPRQTSERLRDLGLTPRQVDVALELRLGGTNREVAERLGITEGTLRTHLEAVFAIFGVHDRVSAVARIVGLGEDDQPGRGTGAPT